MAPEVLCLPTPSLSPHRTLILMTHLLIFLSSNAIAQSINKSEIDRQALLSFKSGLSNDRHGVLRSWRNDSLDFCSWRGVTCGMTVPLRVVSLDLNSLNLTGKLSPCIANLTSLARMDLGNNRVYGTIPEELGTLRHLQFLMLASNNLEGTIPRSLGSSKSLTYVNLGYNLLSGGISDSLANSLSLSELNLTTNNFSGIIPANLFNGSSELLVVDLGSNLFSGFIPDFYKMPALQILNLADNILAGSIPPSLGNVSSLTVLDLGYNNLIGRIPSGIGYSLPKLETLSMSGNKFEGSIPASLANASKLLAIDLSNNSLTGPAPSLGSLSDLYALLLGSNNLEAQDWAFLTSLTNCTQLQILAMDGNDLNGSLPRSVGNLSTTLLRIDLGHNQIVGTIPVEIGNLRNLQMLTMDQNLLSGGIPSVIGNLSQLFVLILSGNRFSGQIPSTIGNVSLLSELHLDNNNLSGNVSLGNCKQLLMLNLSVNSLDGSIPSQLLNITSLSLGLDLSNNYLTGSIPQEIGALIHLGLLDVSFNNLSGEIPVSIGQCVNLLSLNLKRNMLNGAIPKSFSNLKSIDLIDLSQNNFVGQIPEFFGNFPFLVQLDLSDNYFEGPIPTSGIFLNTSAVTLDGNTRLCASATTITFGFQMCPTTSAGKTKKNARLLVIVIPPVTTIALFSLLCFMATLLKRRQAHATPCYIEPLKRVSYGDILKATNCLSPVNKISSSRTGSIYIGRFEFETDLVAIKLFHLDEIGAHNSFLTECEVLRNTRHRNLVKAVTLCSTVDLENNEFKAIVFEFMANGSLDMWVHPKLHQNRPKRGLSMSQRIRIAMDVASALDYMHNQLTPPLIHCDMKPSNVFLDYDMTARVGDFGSAKFLSSSPEGSVGLGGTIGYIAPECWMGCEISTACDVYSFGVLLLEMLTGKRPTDAMFSDGLSLRKVVRSAFPDRLREVLDPHMPHEEHHACAAVLMQGYVLPLVEVGLLCSMDSPKDRPGMRDVCARIFAINESFLQSGTRMQVGRAADSPQPTPHSLQPTVSPPTQRALYLSNRTARTVHPHTARKPSPPLHPTSKNPNPVPIRTSPGESLAPQPPPRPPLFLPRPKSPFHSAVPAPWSWSSKQAKQAAEQIPSAEIELKRWRPTTSTPPARTSRRAGSTATTAAQPPPRVP